LGQKVGHRHASFYPNSINFGIISLSLSLILCDRRAKETAKKMQCDIPVRFDMYRKCHVISNLNFFLFCHCGWQKSLWQFVLVWLQHLCHTRAYTLNMSIAAITQLLML
jgi:uncharacterized protein (DUF983 family)